MNESYGGASFKRAAILQMEITLSPTELREIDQWAKERQDITSARGKKDRYGYQGDGLEAHRKGVAAEFAVAKLLELEDVWTPVVERYEDLEADVGWLNVRGTSHPYGRLILHKSDEDFPFILVTYPDPPLYRLVGWTMGSAGKREEWWCDPTGRNRWAYFVPQSALLATTDLYEDRHELRPNS